MDIVTTSSSRPGTDFDATGAPAAPPLQTRLTSLEGRRYRGT
jgi:hypothetical protein